MGAWGNGPFQNDATLDEVALIQRSLLKKIDRAIRAGDDDEALGYAGIIVELAAHSGLLRDEIEPVARRLEACVRKNASRWKHPQLRLRMALTWIARFRRAVA